MWKHLPAACLIGLELAAMIGGMAWDAKCRNEGLTCCVSFAGIGLICR